jgi:hypothetical protein
VASPDVFFTPESAVRDELSVLHGAAGPVPYCSRSGSDADDAKSGISTVGAEASDTDRAVLSSMLLRSVGCGHT